MLGGWGPGRVGSADAHRLGVGAAASLATGVALLSRRPSQEHRVTAAPKQQTRVMPPADLLCAWPLGLLWDSYRNSLRATVLLSRRVQYLPLVTR